MWLIVVLLLPSTVAFDRYSKDYERGYAVEETVQYRSVSHTFPNRTQCAELCEVPCSITHVYMQDMAREMFTCNKLKPPKVTLLASIKSNSFYMTLIVLGAVVAAILLLLTLCFCCSYCCRQPTTSSRGSSKDALNPQEDGEFRSAPKVKVTVTDVTREYLAEDVGAVKRERDFARRPPRQAHIV